MKKFSQLKDKEWLDAQLHQKSRIQVARELGCSRGLVEGAAKKRGITFVKPWIRAQPPPPKIQFFQLQDKEWLLKELETKPKLQIAEEIGATYSAVTYMAKKHGIVVGRNNPRRTSATRSANLSKYIKREYPNGRVGQLAGNWRGGITKENHLLRSRQETKCWRVAVFIRDDYTCRGCGVRGGWLEADHVKSWAEYPALRWDVSNGRTLCRPCHILTFKGRPKKKLSTPSIFFIQGI